MTGKVRNMKKQVRHARQLWYLVFDTPVGGCGIGWSPRGITSVSLPEADVAALKDRFGGHQLMTSEDDAPDFVREAVDKIRRHLTSGDADFSGLPLDLEDLPSFHRTVYQRAIRMPPGTVMSYGELAMKCGKNGAARAVGNAMAHNPLPLIVPCHRIVAAGGRPGGFSSHGGIETKRKLLSIEGYTLK
jgi:methylated-DNA-[protein]-cysteine S-methyltransferase